MYAENWFSPLVGHPPNQGPDDCSDIPVEVGTAEVVAGRTFYAVMASKEQYNRFTGTPATEAWLDVIFWDYDPAGGRAVKMVHLLPIGFVPGPSSNAWADIDLDALRRWHRRADHAGHRAPWPPRGAAEGGGEELLS